MIGVCAGHSGHGTSVTRNNHNLSKKKTSRFASDRFGFISYGVAKKCEKMEQCK